ncbi:hypothetical protein L1049_014193 [Liquidambar formosana]|uniref:Protein kinase domain-containing protein n=1 Tax=Liquidambar formosana TaxID=63359 RepID=A0AAP0RRL0_LIQFO
MEKQASWVRGKCVGRGSFGTVHLAVMRSDGHVFAAKSVDMRASLPSQVESLENEIRVLRSLSSPHVVKYLGDDVSYDSPTTSYRNLHVEYLPGGTIADVATGFGGKVGDVEERIVRSYTWCILSALRYVHSKNVVHCDVKGKNVLVGITPGTAKLADFGAAKRIDGELSCRKTPISPRGSPLWMAPEVIRREYQGPESDVWSLGCTVIEMITGEPAWEDRGVDTLCRIGFCDELPEIPTQLSELGRDFLGKCLRREPSERWSCDQLLQHPFVSSFSANTTTDSSPRCVLEWFGSDFSDEDDEDSENSRSKLEEHAITARGRIMELASSRGAIWESDGWVVVRDWNSGSRDEGACASSRGDEGEGISLEYTNSVGWTVVGWVQSWFELSLWGAKGRVGGGKGRWGILQLV